MNVMPNIHFQLEMANDRRSAHVRTAAASRLARRLRRVAPAPAAFVRPAPSPATPVMPVTRAAEHACVA